MHSGQGLAAHRVNRRTVLSGVAASAVVGVAGCLQNNGRLPAPIRGDPEADVTVMAFEDYACPHCREYSLNVVPKLQPKYFDPGVVRYEFHDFPVPVEEPTSWRAANAAREAQKRGGDEVFWEYQRRLFENQRRLGPGVFESIATELDIDGAAVREAAVDQKHSNTVEADRKMGEDQGVEGTPTVFVEGEAVQPTADAIATAIEDARSN